MPRVPPQTSLPPSGEQYEISCGEQRATVVEVGAGIRAYSDGDRDVLEPYAREAMCDAAHGAPLIPWPNRIAEGSYSFEGRELQLALSEPERANAIHGLLRWRPWQAHEHGDEHVVMRTRLHPMPGYPFALEVEISYALEEDGLTVRTSARNVGERGCPYGAGQHPYLSPGPGALIDECELQLAAATRLLLESRHQVPVGREPVAAGAFDFRSPRAVGAVQLDDAFTDLERGADGRARAALHCPDGQ